MDYMKSQLISDLHTEHYHGSPEDMLRRLPIVPDLDFLLLPGDIVSPAYQYQDECRAVFEFLASKAKHTLLTFGNHEYYGSTVKVEEFIKGILPSNVHLLENSDVTIEGVHFYGGAMWFKSDPLNPLFEQQMNDFNLIKGIHEWVYLKNTEFRENGRRLIKPETVVLSHHLPSPRSTHRLYKGSNLNRFFVSDETELILDKKPRLWVHGHTHLNCDYTLGETRVVCNPLGYPAECKSKKYDPLVIEL